MTGTNTTINNLYSEFGSGLAPGSITPVQMQNMINTFAQRTQWVRVTDAEFGAVGNGTTDDTAAINAAITSISSTGGVVVLPPLNYGISANGLQVTSTQPIFLVGYGATLTAIANSTTLIQVSQGNGGFQYCHIIGIELGGFGFTGIVVVVE